MTTTKGSSVPTREEIIERARVEHDAVCSCDPKYVMSCPRMAATILAQSSAAPYSSTEDDRG